MRGNVAHAVLPKAAVVARKRKRSEVTASKYAVWFL
jgi:hypothetical protein